MREPEDLELQLETAELQGQVAQVTSSIQRSTFTGKGDKEKVPQMYKEYVSRIAGVLQSTLAFGGDDANLTNNIVEMQQQKGGQVDQAMINAMR